jgi:hypothetical protein
LEQKTGFVGEALYMGSGIVKILELRQICTFRHCGCLLRGRRGSVKIVASMVSHLRFAVLALVSTSLVAVVGCGNDGTSVGNVDSDARTLLRLLANEYGEFMNAHDGRIPRDEAEFRKFLAPRTNTVAAGIQFGTIEELLSSPRDKQPLVIVTGTRREPSDAPGVPWAFRERVGVDGQIFAAGVRYGPVELSTAEAESQIPTD